MSERCWRRLDQDRAGIRAISRCCPCWATVHLAWLIYFTCAMGQYGLNFWMPTR
jgi:hypothetical protein